MRGLCVSRAIPVLLIVIYLFSLLALPRALPAFQNMVLTPDPEQGLRRDLENFFQQRTRMLISGEGDNLDKFYDTGGTSGQWALEWERARIEYLHQWAEERGVQLLAASCQLAVVSLDIRGGEAYASVCPHIIITYRQGDSDKIDLMGTRTIHWLELVKRDKDWLVQKDWFLDPFEGGRALPAAVGETMAGEAMPAAAGTEVRDIKVEGHYNREGAVRYAHRYVGVRLGPGTGRYNQKYRDYSLGGGDCANFASQVLADEEAGGLPQDWIWFYGNDGGSQAWIQAQAFVNYFLSSGRAQCIMRGSYAEVSASTAEHPRGAIGRLLPGDIIGYEFDGMISHVSIVVGQNSAGYPVVNSHSADRFQVPWDLGYDRNTTFWLLQIKG